jgi:hypothetical protein
VETEEDNTGDEHREGLRVDIVKNGMAKEKEEECMAGAKRRSSDHAN